MSCGKCPDFTEEMEEKYKHFDWEQKKEEQKEIVPEPEPVKDKRPWWKKLKDRIDPAGIGGLLPNPSMGW